LTEKSEKRRQQTARWLNVLIGSVIGDRSTWGTTNGKGGQSCEVSKRKGTGLRLRHIGGEGGVLTVNYYFREEKGNFQAYRKERPKEDPEGKFKCTSLNWC